MIHPLRPYQQQAVDEIRAIEWLRHLAVVAPTGSGKTRIMVELLLEDKKQIVLTHRRVLLDQLAEALSEAGIRFGYRASGHGADLDANIQLAMLPTEYQRAHKENRWLIHEAERIHVDEVHALGGPTAVHVVNAYKRRGARLLGYTATPVELGHLVDDAVEVASVRQLQGQGYLVPYLAVTPDAPSCEKLANCKRQSNGEFSQKGLKRIWRADRIVGRVVEYYRKLNPSHKPSVLFAQGVPESLYFAQQFVKAGIPAAHIDGDSVWVDGESYESDAGARRDVFDRVRDGDIKVVTNRFVLREGWNLPEIEHVILTCVFGTRSIFTQACGRGLRIAPGKERCVFQDHGGNFWRFPMLDDDSEPWDIFTPQRISAKVREARMREGEISDPIVCPQCFTLRVEGPECPECGYRSSKRARPVIQMDGTLRMVTGPLYRKREVHREPGQAEQWEMMFWGARDYTPKRTLEQVWCFNAAKNNWKWLPRDLPLMPKQERHWYVPVGKLKMSDLR